MYHPDDFGPSECLRGPRSASEGGGCTVALTLAWFYSVTIQTRSVFILRGLRTSGKGCLDP